MGNCFKVILLFILGCNLAFAQDLEVLRKQFPEDRQVYLKKIEELKFQFNKDTLEIIERNEEERILLNDRIIDDGSDEIVYAPPFSSYLNGKATSRIYDSGRYKNGIGVISDEQNRSQNEVFYDDIRMRKVSFPGLSMGSIVQLNYSLRIHHPLFLSSSYFSTGSPILSSVYRVILPEGVRIGWQLRGDSSMVKLRIEKRKGLQILVWEATNLPKYRFYRNGLSYRHYIPQIYVWLHSYVVDGKEVLFNHSMDAFNKLNYSFIREAMNSDLPTPQKQLVDSIVTFIKSPRDRASALFRWVQENIRYISIEDGFSGQVPRTPETVCKNGYGDCKDMAVLLTRLMKKAGLPAYPVWIGTREVPRDFRELQHLASSNHMIASLKTDTGWIFLDATGREQMLGQPSVFTQGRYACIAIDSAQFEKVLVPWEKADNNQWIDTLWCSIKGDTLLGNGTTSLSGYYRDRITSAFRDREPAKYEELMKGILSRGNDKCKIQKPMVSQLFELGKPLLMTFQLELDHYVRKIDDEFYLNLNLKKAWETLYADTSGGRSNGREFDFLFKKRDVIVLTIPPNFKPVKLPENAEDNNSFCQWKISYQLDKGRILLHSFFELKKAEVNFEELSDFNSALMKIKEAQNLSLILKKQ